MTPSLTLQWIEAGQEKNQTIQGMEANKNPGTLRIGRDRTRCDLVLSDLTVSGLHIEIFFNDRIQLFYIRNLRDTNPPLINGKILHQGEIVLNSGTQIQLGQVEIKVIQVSITPSGIPPTILLPPQTNKPLGRLTTGPTEYGLKCPKCLHISNYSQLNIGCSWCGTSLAAAISVILPPP
ncbi:peptide-binding protein [Oscillatoriales cyanobacterium USR001]|nr:peptide-binding protein [Oscillatoriales cyanobacterium USR001]